MNSAIRRFSRSVFVSGAIFVSALATRQATAQQPARHAPPPALKLTSPSFTDGGTFPVKYSCAAMPDSLRPQLQWTNTPADTAVFVLIMHDAEVHHGKGINDNLHWFVWNIPGSATQLAEGSPKGELPPGSIVGKNTSGLPKGLAGEAAYAPPCAPRGEPHHYLFDLYAVDKKIDLPETASRDDVMKAMDGHIVGKSIYTMVFSRPEGGRSAGIAHSQRLRTR